jgi:hypothetical protein
VTVRSSKMWLSIGWLAVVTPLLIILILRQLNEFYGNDPKEVWSWVSQFVLPGLTLLAGAWTVSASPSDQKPLDNPAVFWVALILSIFYLGVLYLVVATQATSNVPWGEVFKQSALYLGLIQGLVIAVLGKFFIESGRL